MRLYRPVFRVFVLTLLTLPWAGSLVSRAQVPERMHGQHASATASELRNTPVTLPAPEAPDAVGRLFAAFNDTLRAQIATDAMSRLFAVYNDTLGAQFATDAVSRLFAVYNDTLGAQFATDAVSRLFAAYNDTLGTQTATDAMSRLFAAYNDTLGTQTATDAISRMFAALNDTSSSSVAITDAVSRLFTAYNDTLATAGPTDAISRMFAVFNSQLVAPRAASTVRDTLRYDWSPTSGFNAYRLYLATAPSAEAIFDSVSVGSDTTAAYATGLADSVRYFARLGGSEDGGSSFTDFSPFNSGTLIDRNAPQTAISTGPAAGGYTNAEPVLFTFTGTDNGSPSDLLRFSWRMDGSAFSAPATTTSASFPGLAEGAHAFEVFALDPAGNADASPAVGNFTVDRTPPETQIASGPAANEIVSTNALTYGWTGTDDRSPTDSLRFEYRLDGAAFGNTTRALTGTLSNVADGAHTFAVHTLDLAGNADASPAIRAVVVDAVGPAVSLVSGPAPNACLATGSTAFTWTAADVVSARATLAFAFTLDAAPASAFGPDTTATLIGLADGLHTFTVQSRDERGHVGSATRTFRVDRQAPVAFTPAAQVLDASKVRFTCTGSDNSGITAFHLQISTDLAFATVTQEADLGAAGVFDFTGVPGNTYYGRARASDCAGNTSVYSEPSNNGTLSNLANLVTTRVVTPDSAVASQVLHVEYTVADSALGATTVPAWSDDIYLTPGTTFDAGTALFLARVQNLTYLNTNESYTVARDVTLPVGIQGAWHVLVIADALGQVPETRGDDNVRASAVVHVTLGAVADLEVTVAPPLAALSGRGTTMQWTVTNAGTGRTPVDRWFDTVFYSPDRTLDIQLVGGGSLSVQDTPLGTFEHVGALEPGQSYTDTATVTVPGGVQGFKWFVVAADLNVTAVNQVVSERGAVFEDQHEHNFSTGDSTDIALVLPPDLVVDTLRVVPGPAPVSGSALTVHWVVRNHGFSDTPTGVWSDRVWLSSDVSLDAGDVLLGTFPHGGGLALDRSYAAEQAVTIPNGVAGSRFLILTTDAFGQLEESDEANNTFVNPSAVAIALSPWPNLKPVSGSAPDTVGAGQTAQLQWTVSNLSPNNRSVSASWRDDVYLSASATWNPAAAVLVAAPRTTHNLAPGQSYSATATVALPTSSVGRHYVYVMADAQNEVFEHTSEGDNLQQVASLYVRAYPRVDVVVSNVAPSSNAVSTGDVLAASWTLRNEGQGATLANSWPEELWLSADTLLSPLSDLLMVTAPHGGALLAGDGANGSATLGIPPGLAGTFHVLIRSDPNAVTGDADLANNVGASAATVAITSIPVASIPNPDLTVTSVTLPGSGVAGQPLHVDVGLQNLGPGNIVARNWSVSAYLSVDTRLDGSDIPLGSIAGPNTIAAAASEVRGLDTTLPNYASGAYFLILSADSRNEVLETNEDNNLSLRPLLVVLPPPADLVVEGVTFDAPNATPGRAITVRYTLRNIGANPAVGQLQNAVYLSADLLFDSTVDPLVGLETANIDLAPGAVATLKQEVTLAPLPLAGVPAGLTGATPPLTPGPYHGIVHANVRASIRESDAGNNGATSPGTVQGEMDALTLEVPEPFVLTLGQQQFYRVAVLPGQDLSLTMASDVGAATNEMFVAFGRTPTGSDYDFAGPAGFTATPNVLVPGTQAGEYFVMVTARGLGTQATAEHDTLLARLLPFQLTAHTPAAGGDGGSVTGHVRGAGLRDTTVVRLEQAGVPFASAALVRFVNSTDLLVRWNLAGVPLGVYDVVAVNGTERVVLPAAFTVEASRVAALSIEPDHADVLRRTAIAPFTFTFRNTSNQDVASLRARIVYPASSILRALVTSPGLLTRSERAPELFAAVAQDAYVVYDPGGGDSLAVVDLVGTNLAPGEGRSVTVSVSGFATSPYSVLAMTGVSTLRELLDRESGLGERARQALLTSPGSAPGALLGVAGDRDAFRERYLIETLQRPGLVDEVELANYLAGQPTGLPIDTNDRSAAGPAQLLSEALAGNCVVPSAVPDCTPEVAPVTCALPGCRVVFDTPLPVALPLEGGAVVSVPSSVSRGYTEFDCADTKIVAPCDPNAITGPAGFGSTEHWWSAGKTMDYTVDFENLAGVANAAAQRVEVEVPLDAGFDVNEFRLGSAGFGGLSGKTIAGSFGTTAFDDGGTFYNDLGFYVQYTASLDTTRRVAKFVFQSLGLDRRPTSSPSMGFLPVNDGTSRGTGYVKFSIKPRAGIAPGATVMAQASVKFDENAPVNTNQATNRIDNQLPVSSVTPALEILDTTHVRIHWAGNDRTNGSGLKGYSVFLQQDAGAFTGVGTLLTSNAMELTVQRGHSYSFFTRATDNTDNLEPQKSVPDQVVTIGIVVLGSDGPQLPRLTLLHQNAPNPWRGTTLIRFELASDSDVTLEVFDIQGRVVAIPLDHKQMQAGTHSIPLDRLPGGPGVYFYRIHAKAFESTKRMVRLR